MDTPLKELPEVPPIVGLWLKPFACKARWIGFADLAFPDDRGCVVAGKGRSAHIFVEGDDLVSTRHWQIEARDGEFWISDLDSTNGTSINGVPLTGEFRLEPGYRIQFGDSFATFCALDQRLPVEGATYTSWLCNAANAHGSARAAAPAIHRGKSTINNARKKRDDGPG